jgi:hypothetical protein
MVRYILQHKIRYRVSIGLGIGLGLDVGLGLSIELGLELKNKDNLTYKCRKYSFNLIIS